MRSIIGILSTAADPEGALAEEVAGAHERQLLKSFTIHDGREGETSERELGMMKMS